MTKERKTIIVAVTVLLVSAVAYSAVAMLFPTRRLALTEFYGPRGGAVFGLPLVEQTFENHVIMLSSNIIIGTIVTTPPEGRVQHQGIFEVQVKEDIISRTAENTIMVSAENNLFEVGETYLMLLSRIARTPFPFDFYVADSEFVFRVDGPGDQVQRLVNPAERVFTAPFQNPKYNSLSQLRQYIRGLAPANRMRYLHRDRDVKVLEEAPSHAALINLADHILLIETISAELNANGTAAMVGFRTIHTYKGEGIHDTTTAFTFKGVYVATTLFLPADVEINQRYLVFLVEEDAGHIAMATRRGSVVGEDDPEFSSLLEKLPASRR